MYYRWFNRIFSIYKLILDILLLRSARYPHPIAWNYLCLFGGIFRPDKCFSLYFVSDFIGCSCLRFPYSSCRYPEACQGGNCVEKHRDATRDRTQDLLLTKRTRYLCAICPPLARLAQSVERKALNLVVVGSSPTVGDHFLYIFCSSLRFQLHPLVS